MPKHKPVVEMLSHGIYRNWDAKAKSLPKIDKFTTQIPAELGIEFGYIVNIKRAKNARLIYCIYHPGIPDEHGDVMPPFEGEEYVGNNDWDFYLGDTLWEPLSNKTGPWRMTLELDGRIIADKTFEVEDEAPYEGASFWRRGKLRPRGY